MAGNLTTAVVGTTPGVIYGSPGSDQEVTVLNLDTANTVWVGYSASMGPAVGGGGIPVGPGASMQFDGGTSIYAVATASVTIAVGPGVTGYFLPASLTNIGGSKVYVQAGQPSGTIPVNSVWFDTANGSLQTWNGTTWVNQAFNAQQLIQAATILGTQIASQAVTAANIANGTVTAAQIANGTLTTAQIAAAAGILGSQIAAATVTSSNIAANTIVAANIAANTITAAQIAAATITGGNIAAGTITASNIAANTITAAQLAAGIIYAGIVNSTTINAATFTGSTFQGTDFVINSAGAFFYSGSPAAGNLIASIASAAGTDAHTNTYPAGFGLFRSSNAAALLFSFLTGQSYENTPGRVDSFVVGSGAGAQLALIMQSAFVTNRLDSAAIVLESSTQDGTTAAAAGSLDYVATSGAAVTMAEWGPGGFIGLGTMTAVDPTTGTPASPAALEAWHNFTLDSGWTAGGQAPQYRLLPDGNVQVRGSATHAGTTAATNINGSNPVPVAYRPAQGRIYRPPITQDAAGTVQMGSNGILAMRASGFTATQAILDGTYSVA